MKIRVYKSASRRTKCLVLPADVDVATVRSKIADPDFSNVEAGPVLDPQPGEHLVGMVLADVLRDIREQGFSVQVADVNVTHSQVPPPGMLRL